MNDLEDPLPSKGRMPVLVSQYFQNVIQSSAALKKTVLPSEEENDDLGFEDPLEEKGILPCIVHKYNDRVLFLVTNRCATYCRYCTRSRIVGNDREEISNWQDGIKYIQEHSCIRDVLISGGDPFVLKDDQLIYILSEIRKIKHVEIIRIGTKIPVVNPSRITDRIVSFLKDYHPLYINIHFTHPDELTFSTKEACEKLANAGIPLGSQTVLLKGVNDDNEILKKLFLGLLKIRVKPYYLYQCDQVKGTSHFWTSPEKGIEIIDYLRKTTTGFAVPNFIIDSPQGKICISPNNILGKYKNNWLLYGINGNSLYQF